MLWVLDSLSIFNFVFKQSTIFFMRLVNYKEFIKYSYKNNHQLNPHTLQLLRASYASCMLKRKKLKIGALKFYYVSVNYGGGVIENYFIVESSNKIINSQKKKTDPTIDALSLFLFRSLTLLLAYSFFRSVLSNLTLNILTLPGDLEIRRFGVTQLFGLLDLGKSQPLPLRIQNSLFSETLLVLDVL